MIFAKCSCSCAIGKLNLVNKQKFKNGARRRERLKFRWGDGVRSFRAAGCRMPRESSCEDVETHTGRERSTVSQNGRERTRDDNLQRKRSHTVSFRSVTSFIVDAHHGENAKFILRKYFYARAQHVKRYRGRFVFALLAGNE